MFRKTDATGRPQKTTARGTEDRWAVLKQDLHRRLIAAVDHAALRNMDETQIRHQLRLGAEELCRSRPDLLSPAERGRLIDELVDETLGFGPLERLLHDPTISDILINGPKFVFVERNGRIESTDVKFYSDEHLLATVQKIVSRVGRRIDESSPMVDARLPDGSRVNAIMGPLALDGTLVSIRRFRADAITADDLVASEALSTDMLHFLLACIKLRANIVISGGTGSGKTTLLNILSSAIPATDRVVTIEDAAELRLAQPHAARLETRPPNLEGSGEVTARDLLRNALRMRPDRIVIGECRGGEAFDMLQAMNTGHDGSLTTLHANSTHDAISRLEMLVGLSGLSLSPGQIARQIASAIHLLVHVSRLDDGRRKIVQISEIDTVCNDQIVLADLFSFESTGLTESGRIAGRFQAHGRWPRLTKKARSQGMRFPGEMFGIAAAAAEKGRNA